MWDDCPRCCRNNMVTERLAVPPAATAASGTVREIERIRKESSRKRLLSEEWNSTAIPELITIVTTKICNGRLNVSKEEYERLVIEGLCQLDQVKICGQVAAQCMEVMRKERLQLSRETRKMYNDVVKEEVEVEELRRVLKREKKLVNHRYQLEGISKILLRLPQRDDILSTLAVEETKMNDVQEQIAHLELERVKLEKELSLLVHCSKSVQISGEKMGKLIHDDEDYGSDYGEVKEDIIGKGGADPLVDADAVDIKKKKDRRQIHDMNMNADAMDTS